MKFLFVDNDESFLLILKKTLLEIPGAFIIERKNMKGVLIWAGDLEMLITECHDVGTVLLRFVEFMPNVVFLDNNLSRGNKGNEGQDIVSELKNRPVKIYSTTDDPSVIPWYQEQSIRVVGKDLGKYKQIILDLEQKEKKKTEVARQ